MSSVPIVIARVIGVLLRGLEGRQVTVEVDVGGGFETAITLVGLAAASVRESRQRIEVAMRNQELLLPKRRITINLAPAQLRKEQPGLDLPIAVGIVLGGGGRTGPDDAAFLGELALDGSLRHVNGVLVAAGWARARGLRRLFVPAGDAPEAALVEGLQVLPCRDLAQVVAHLHGEALIEPETPAGGTRVGLDEAQPSLRDISDISKESARSEIDLADVQGQETARRALEVAAAGGHHLLMTGSPGAGKTMLARCLPGLLPPLTLEGALEVAQVRSVLGELRGGGALDWSRPFRAPHHSISSAGLVGGGSGLPLPGEISRAHRGVLFLDELAEFAPRTLQLLRQPLEQGEVVLTRAAGTVRYPARFQLVAATNPCPCGFLGDPERACRCTPAAIEGYQRALSGPLLDRMDLQVAVPRVPLAALHGQGGEASATVGARVAAARAAQLERQGKQNADLGVRDLHRQAPLEPGARAALERWATAQGLSARGFHRAWRVARTLADLEGGVPVAEDHVLEALGYRIGDRAA
ncbi:MAG: YifB family Mg chelatase-like AAA ATPase [Candidatus Dormiibacterota bacterium]